MTEQDIYNNTTKNTSRPNIPLERYKYEISDITLTADGFEEPITVRSSFVTSLSFIKDFDNTISPKIQLMFQIEKEYYNDIILNMNTLVATFVIYKTNIGEVTDDSNITDPNNTLLEQSHIWQEVTLKAVNDNNISLSEQLQVSGDKSNVDTSVESTQQTVNVTLLLYDSDKIDKYRKSNYFIASGGKNDILCAMFADRGLTNILMTPTDNAQNTYIIPYGHLGDNISALNTYYGIYQSPYTFFMDLDYIYLLDRQNVGNTLRPREYKTVTIYVDKENRTGYISDGSYTYVDSKNDRMGNYILNANKFYVSDNDSSIDYAMGGNIRTVIGGTGEVKNDKIGDYNIDRTIVVDNNLHHSQILYSIKEQKRNLQLEFSNIDLSILTPNKRYRIIPDSTYYNSKYNIEGDYRLSKMLLIFKKTAEKELNMSTQIVLNKIQ